MNDLVSIIMPSYNCGRYVEDTIRSVQRQTYTNWEIIFVDDLSSDETVSIVSEIGKIDSRIRLFRNERNVGAAESRNKALREAKGRWIAFLDSDDLWLPDKLEKQVRFMRENGYRFSYTGYSEMDSDGKDTGVVVSGPKKISKRGMFAFCWPGCLTVMYDASVIGLLQISDIKKNNDYAMWLKVCRDSDCFLLDECLAKYRRGRSGSVSSHGILTMIQWHYKLFHEAEGMNVISSLFCTVINLVCGLYKKIHYVRKV